MTIHRFVRLHEQDSYVLKKVTEKWVRSGRRDPTFDAIDYCKDANVQIFWAGLTAIAIVIAGILYWQSLYTWAMVALLIAFVSQIIRSLIIQIKGVDPTEARRFCRTLTILEKTDALLFNDLRLNTGNVVIPWTNEYLIGLREKMEPEKREEFSNLVDDIGVFTDVDPYKKNRQIIEVANTQREEVGIFPTSKWNL